MNTSDGDLGRERVPALLAARDDATCRVREVLDRVGEKWAISVIAELGKEPRRFNELRRAIPGVSQRMLTATLRGLERDGLVTRAVHPVVPPRVEYELTPLGETLLDTVSALLGWALDHIDDIDKARIEYDAH
ncbi:winged helix-turn-helix transcriptional regulator [Microbispora corallina]|uniref:winged helix-turn-helix transcriptional regulator n=1 Tax=Microbispora corallina TaxID=83302 RepID=UPI001EF36E51|nr:helix-turn-helix domain-containing protein [Microbispora corallina]